MIVAVAVAAAAAVVVCWHFQCCEGIVVGVDVVAVIDVVEVAVSV